MKYFRIDDDYYVTTAIKSFSIRDSWGHDKNGSFVVMTLLDGGEKLVRGNLQRVKAIKLIDKIFEAYQ